MTAWQFLHVTFAWHGAPAKFEDLEAVFGKANDWMRYTPTTWIIRTKQTPTVWADRIFPLLPNPSLDQFLVVKIIKDESQGRLPDWIWNWINKVRTD